MARVTSAWVSRLFNAESIKLDVVVARRKGEEEVGGGDRLERTRYRQDALRSGYFKFQSGHYTPVAVYERRRSSLSRWWTMKFTGVRLRKFVAPQAFLVKLLKSHSSAVNYHTHTHTKVSLGYEWKKWGRTWVEYFQKSRARARGEPDHRPSLSLSSRWKYNRPRAASAGNSACVHRLFFLSSLSLSLSACARALSPDIYGLRRQVVCVCLCVRGYCVNAHRSRRDREEVRELMPIYRRTSRLWAGTARGGEFMKMAAARWQIA